MNLPTRAAFIAAAIILAACAAPTPQSAEQATAAAKPQATAVAQPQATAATKPTTAAPAASSPSGDRPFAKMTTAERSKIASAPPPLGIDVKKLYIATIKTSKGEIKVELDPGAAPQTVNNFVFLSRNGFYDGLTFHRVEPNFVIQGGDPAGNGTGGPGYTVPPEINLKHIDGAIAMARTGGPAATTPNSGSQFYITIGAQPALDGNYTAFGKTLSGQDVVRKIVVGDKIERIDIVEGGATTSAPAAAAAAAPTALAIEPTKAPAPAECRVLTETVLSEPPQLKLLADDHVTGKADAVSTIVEYADMQCPVCAQFDPINKNLMATFSDTIKFVFRHYPLPMHDKALIAAAGVEAAGEQGKFDEMQTLLYEKQAEWDKTPVAEFTKTLVAYAGTLKLDTAKFEAALAKPSIAARVARDMKSGDELQVPGTPTIFLDGQPVPAQALADASTEQSLKTYLKRRAAYKAYVAGKPLTFNKPDQVAKVGEIYEMTLKTSQGDVVLELDPKLAPVNVNSTVFLAQKGYFKGMNVALNDPDVHAILLQDPSNTGFGSPGYDCDAELPAAGAFATAGTVALFRSPGPDSNSSGTQIIITHGDASALDGQFTVIGKVTKGLDIVTKLVADDGKGAGDKVISVSVSKKG